MGITSITRDFNDQPNVVRLETSDSLATAGTTGYLTAQKSILQSLNSGIWQWFTNDMVLVSASDGLSFFTVSADLTSLLLYSTAGAGGVTLPVVDGDFTVFDGTLGQLKDAGYSASNPAKTKVVMANSAVIVNHIAVFSDTAGTIDDDAATAINAGNIQAGIVGTPGALISQPSDASSNPLILKASNNFAGTGNTITITNSGDGVIANTVYSIPSTTSTASNFIMSDGISVQTINSGDLKIGAGGYLRLSVTNGITAFAGGGQGSATPLPSQINRVTTAGADGASVLLPGAGSDKIGVCITILNQSSAHTVDVFPNGADQIDGQAASTAFNVGTNDSVAFYCAAVGFWNSFLTG